MLVVYRRHVSTFIYYPWILTQGDLKVDTVSTRTHKIRYSKSVARFHFVEKDTDEAFYQTITTCLDTGDYGYVIFMDEPARKIIENNLSSNAYDVYLSIPRDNDLSRIVTDKGKFQAWCERHDIAVPPTKAPVNASDALKHAREFGYPVVLKGVAGYGGRAVKICRDDHQVRKTYERLAARDQVLIQPFITGPVGSTSFVALRGKVAAWTASEKFIALKEGLGPSAVRRLRHHPELGLIAQRIASNGKVTGITGFDWMEIAPGQFVVIDPHIGRCTPPAVISHMAGVHLGKAVHELLADNVTLQEPLRGEGRIVVLFPQIIELIFQGGLWQLLTKAWPFSKNVSYYFGPKEEALITFHVAREYITQGFKVFAGNLRRRLFSIRG